MSEFWNFVTLGCGAWGAAGLMGLLAVLVICGIGESSEEENAEDRLARP